MENIKGRRVSARRAEGRRRRKRERVKWQEESLSAGEESEFKGKRKRVKQENKRVEKKSERLCDSSAAEQQATERRKSRFELIFVEEVNMIVQGPSFQALGFLRRSRSGDGPSMCDRAKSAGS